MIKSKWIYRHKNASEEATRLQTITASFLNDENLSPLISELLISRGINSLKECQFFLHPTLEDLHDPFKLLDMDRSITRILKARDKKEKIVLYGDYDADGTIGVSILFLFLKKINCNVHYYIPNRLVTGYGLHLKPLAELIENGMDLLITIDNGISAIDEVGFCNSHGVDVIITDHHECHGIMPKALGIINPKRKDSPYPFVELCGAGVAFKLIQGLSTRLNLKNDFQELIECVAVATVADLVPLKGENRTLTLLGLNYLNENPQNTGLKQLIAISKLRDIKAWHFGFILGPKINAAGRLGQADRIVKLLTTNESTEAYQLAEFLNAENEKRQYLEKEILKKAIDQIATKKLYHKDIIIVSDEGWHPGVIGIVASRIQDLYYRPVIVIGIENNIGKGSCRSVQGFNLFKALSSFGHLFTNFGGHEQAAGFTIPKDNINQLQEEFERYAQQTKLKKILQKPFYYDQQVALKDLNWDLYHQLALFEPCGIGNPGIQFLIDNPQINHYGKMGKDKSHLWIEFDGIRGIGFGMGSYGQILEEKKSANYTGLSFIVKLTINEYRGQENLQLQIKDIKINPLYNLEVAKDLVDYIKNENKIDPDELNKRLNGLDVQNLGLSIEKLRKMYRFLTMTRKEKNIPIDAFKKIAFNAYQVLISLEILKENKLIDFKVKGSIIIIDVLPVTKKKDIKNSDLMIKLRTIIN